MSDVVIRVENLTKEYCLGVINHGTLHRDLQSWWAGVRGKDDPNSLVSTGDNTGSLTDNPHMLALKDISFDVKQGEILGIIGRNGAGKSTLLKILSRVTAPTKGTIKIKGRVASLLEVGTGFHPELTGRENIYLNGAILGMTRGEIDKKFEEIVAFAEVEKFIDTPVKRYSSGMHVRLGFAVAAHLDPEILIVDEVLAVGDAAFQKKCLGKIGDVAKGGRTVLFVSHNMASIVQLCHKAAWISEGAIRMIDNVEKTVQAYLASGLSTSKGRVDFEGADETKEADISSIELMNGNDEIASEFDVRSPIKVCITFCCRHKLVDLRVGVSVTGVDGITIFSTTTQDYGSIKDTVTPGIYKVQLLIPDRFLASGDYYLGVGMSQQNIKRHALHENILNFKVTGSPFKFPRNVGFLVYPFKWQQLEFAKIEPGVKL